MFKRSLLAILLTLTSLPAIAQDLRATTEDGRPVILRSNGTWTLAQAAKPSATLPRFQKSASATRKIPAPHGQFAVFIDPKRWKQDKTEDNKIFLEAISGKAYGMVIAEGLSVPTKSLREVILTNAQRMDSNARIVSEEKRVVNNREVLCIELEATYSGISFTYLGYYYGGSSGNVQLVAFTPKTQFASVRPEVEDFLNGLEISDNPLPETSDLKTIALNDGKIQLAYDSTKWKAPEKADGGKLRLSNARGNGWMLLIPESITFPLDSFLDIAIDNLKKVDPDASTLVREKRTVHGQTIGCLKMSANIKGLPFTYYGYYYSGPAGSIQALAYTTASNFPEVEPDFTEVLNTLEIK